MQLQGILEDLCSSCKNSLKRAVELKHVSNIINSVPYYNFMQSSLHEVILVFRLVICCGKNREQGRVVLCEKLAPNLSLQDG